MSEVQYLIVGLGNPGTKYEKTRHNLGFMVVEAFAKKHSLSFKRGERLEGKIAQGVVEGQKMTLLMPTTYMNLSGSAVRKAMQYFKIAREQVLVIVDDVYVKLGAMRLRPTGGTGGHNGLKSIEACLGTQDYTRLRMGVGPYNEDLSSGLERPLEEFVLGYFTFSEQLVLPQVVERGVSIVERWIDQGIEPASQLAGELSLN